VTFILVVEDNTEFKKCECGYCDEDIPLRTTEGKIRRFARGHENRGVNNSRYKGFKYSSHKIPRRMMYMPWHPNSEKSGYIYEYVWLMSRHLKRQLEKGETIHHMDGNPLNNEISNLILFKSHSEHKLFEGQKDVSDRSCSNCGSSETQINQGKYISWYDDEKGGWLCRSCYCKRNYKYVKKGRSRKK
jgi:HNH endonuclease